MMLTACDREAIHIPGSIQPHGLLLIAGRGGHDVIGGAGDIEGRLTPVWQGRPLHLLLAQTIGAALIQAEATPGTLVPLATVPGRREAFDATLHVSGDHVLVELEPRIDAPLGAAVTLSRLDLTATGFERATDLQSLCERAAVGFRELTGFDRVMVYRFLDDGAGIVMAEDRDPALHSFHNHHFPATDIPRQARALYVRNRVRVIEDVDYVPAPIRSDDPTLATIDLSDATLRSVSPVHVQYLKNMGVAASASVSVVRDGLLWGLIAAHNTTPRGLSYETRVAARALAGDLGRQIKAKEEAATYRERIRLRHAEDAIVAQVDLDASFERVFETMGDDLKRMLDADGFAAIQRERLVTSGTVPAPDEIRELARFIGPLAAVEPFSTAALSAQHPPAEDYCEVTSGVLAVSLNTETSSLLMWFRAEQLEVVNWAGNPHKGDAADPASMLTPRTSFAAWSETVHGRSRRWTLAEVDAASRLRRALFDLRQGRRLRELNRELSATVAEKEALLAEKDHLMREVNHRVQNSLQLVQAFLGLQAREGEEPELAAALGEAQRRLQAVALVHRRLYQADQLDRIDLGRYLDELLTDTRSSMGVEWEKAVTLDLAPMLTSSDRAVQIGLILTELVINANKYAYDGKPGPVAITLEQYRNQMRLIVADQGGGRVSGREGFGTRMINAMVQRLDGTIERHDNQPGLRVILTAPVE